MDMAEFTYSHFAYFDKNILSYLAKHQEVWPQLFRFLWDNDLTLCVSGGHAAELSQATRLHPALAELLIQVPWGLVKPRDDIVQEEVQAHPQHRTESLLLQPLNILLGEVDGL